MLLLLLCSAHTPSMNTMIALGNVMAEDCMGSVKYICQRHSMLFKTDCVRGEGSMIIKALLWVAIHIVTILYVRPEPLPLSLDIM